ncbi:MAG TPA: aspartate--tRNA ligase [Planctomycetota bacterium]|nr:aspartate--tRNA ligase [Planctomycetota bacterium]
MPNYVNKYRTHRLNELRPADIDKTVRLSGWVHSYRDMGDVIFIDLRDRTGITQVIFDPARSGQDLHDRANMLRREDVINVTGKVVTRGKDRINPKLGTGEVEVEASELTVLSKAQTPPLEIRDDITVDEKVRLKYRYLDLRRPIMQRNLEIRSKAINAIRAYMVQENFIEVETPFLGKSTPEGARDYLVPSRIHPGHFYALPQSPQMYKQLLMVAGVDRYFQIARCMRDEDLRADRQPEFTQLDLEMSYAERDDIFGVVEGAMKSAFKVAIGHELPTPWPRIDYRECLSKYGDDKPDLRIPGMVITDISALAAETEFAVFKNALAEKGLVKGLCVPTWGTKKSRKNIEDLTIELKVFGAKGMAWMKVEKDGKLNGGCSKFFNEAQQKTLLEKFAPNTATGRVQEGDLLVFIADLPKVCHQTLAFIRNTAGTEMGMKDPTKFAPLWVLDFPLFEYSEEEKRWVSAHHPFTSPLEEDMAFIESDPGRVRSSAYDFVMNGFECASGSVRIHSGELQERMFRALKLSDKDIEERFGFFNNALKYGTPPHAGVAPGLDRIIMLMCGATNIREAIAFPKNQAALDLMTGAPGEVDDDALRMLSIKKDLPPKP